MDMTQQGRLSESDRIGVRMAQGEYEEALRDYREECINAVEKSSYREVARLTGLSTNTLQRWKREAGR